MDKKKRNTYYKPNDSNHSWPVVFKNKEKYKAIRAFLEAIEEVATQAVEDLYSIAEQMDKSPFMNTLRQANREGRDWYIRSRLERPQFGGAKESLKTWAVKYHLSTADSLYERIALDAIMLYLERRTEEGRSFPSQYRQLIGDANSVSGVGDQRDVLPSDGEIQLSQAVHHGIRIFDSFEEDFPFVFSPLPNKQGGPHVEAKFYETILEHDRIKNELLTADNLLMDKENYNARAELTREVARPWEGMAWDPNTPWTNFNDRITEMFIQYKAAYKARTESLIVEEGYEPIPAKRNLDHYIWLAMYQVTEKEYEDISQWCIDQDDDGNADVSTERIRKSLAPTAKLVEITLRPN